MMRRLRDSRNSRWKRAKRTTAVDISVRGTKRSEAHETLRPELAPHGVRRPLHIVGCVELVQRKANAVEAELRMCRTNDHLMPLEQQLRDARAVEPFREKRRQQW